MKIKYPLILIFLLISLASSAILAFEPLSVVCRAESSCAVVQNSAYAHTLGLKNSLYGVVIFSLLLIITLIQIVKPTKIKKKIIKSSLMAGSLIAIYFLFIQIFILHSYCKYCLIVDFAVILAMIISFVPNKEIKIIK
jgi:uncharacterized membrane protein